MRIIIFIFAVFSISSLSAQKGNILALKNFENGQIIASQDATQKGNLSLSNESYDNTVIGVYYKYDESNIPSNPDGSPVLIRKNNVLTKEGIIEVRYNSENGDIKIGDPVTSSNTPGEAMKATRSGMILGIALEDSEKSNSELLKIRISIQYLNF